MYNYTEGAEYRELRRAFVGWTRHVLLPRASPDVPFPAADDLLEIKDMLTDHSRSWIHQWKMQGRQEGLLEGRQEGRQEGLQEGLREGERVLLGRLLMRKFGPLPETIQNRLDAASFEQLEIWSLNILDAQSLDDVFRE